MSPRHPMLLLLLAGCRSGFDGGVTIYNREPAVTILQPVSGTSFDEGTPVEFVAKVDDEDPELLLLTWSSAIDGAIFEESVADSDGNVAYTTANLSVGNHVITLRAVDPEAESGEGEVTIGINDLPDAPTLQIQHPAGSETGVEGTPFKFSAIVGDAQDAPSELFVSLSSDASGHICDMTPDATGYASCEAALGPGDHLLTFTAVDLDDYTKEATTYFTVWSLLEIDNDGDGFTETQGDCDDSDAHTHPGATEEPNGRDDDCDGIIDEGTVYYDDDGDGFTEIAGDCDDTSPTTYPGAPEQLDYKDNDCDLVVDEGTAAYDDDGDGHTELAGDCDDANPTIYPGAIEIPDGKDNNCNGVADEGTVRYDDDGDGYCEAPPCTNASGSQPDCDDKDGRAFPGQTAWFTTARAGGGWDFNCNGAEERHWNEVYRCSASWYSCNSHTPGWSGSAPGCGGPGTWKSTCDWFGFWGDECDSKSGTDTARTQECH